MEIAMTPMPHEYRKKRVLVRCYECRNESATPFHILRLKCRAPDAICGGSYNTVKIGEAPDAEEATAVEDIEASHDLDDVRALMEAMVLTMAGWNARNEDAEEDDQEEEDEGVP